MTMPQKEFRYALIAANEILATTKRGDSKMRNKAFAKIEQELGMRFMFKNKSIPPFHTFVWIDSKADASKWETKLDDHSDKYFVKHCIDCGEEYETINESRTSCDTCHDIRVAHGGYKELELNSDGIVKINNKRVYHRR